MNCVSLFDERAREHPAKPALVLAGSKPLSFGALRDRAAAIAQGLKAHGLQPGDRALMFVPLSEDLYATVIGSLSIGITLLLVEPWMPLERIAHIVRLTQPKIFITGWLGRAWGLRIPEIRSIPTWASPRQLQARPGTFSTIDVEPATPGILTFTSGTTDAPKGVVRTQGYLIDQHRVLTQDLRLHDLAGPDLCIFANFALSNLATGRTSLIVPASWARRHLDALETLPTELQPVSTTCGPAFLRRLLDQRRFPGLQRLHVGGALVDNQLWHEAFARWPDAHFTHVYGGTEAEPVACIDAHDAVRQSERQGFVQSLCVGRPVAAIEHEFREGTLWITGPHVCPAYFGDVPENRTLKRKDERGRSWHCMGDRIEELDGQWYYLGRASQPREEFILEQKIYARTNCTAAFVTRHSATNHLYLVGEVSASAWAAAQPHFPEISDFIPATIVRDRRHRARIDRQATLKARASWLQ